MIRTALLRLPTLLLLLVTFTLSLAQSNVIGWGRNSEHQCEPPSTLTDAVQVAGGTGAALALRANGTVVAWGYNGFGVLNVPAGLGGVVQVASGKQTGYALKSDGKVVAWGDNSLNQLAVPSTLSGVVQIAAGSFFCLALKSDGTVVGFGDDRSGQCTPPVGLSGVVQVFGGKLFSLALKADGTVVAWGANTSGQTTIPLGLTNVVQIGGGDYHSLALKADGTVVGWGYDYTETMVIPRGATNLIQIAGGATHSLGMRPDGTVFAWGPNYQLEQNIPSGGSFEQVAGGEGFTVAIRRGIKPRRPWGWGSNSSGQISIPALLGDIAQTSGGGTHGLFLRADGTVVAVGGNVEGQANVPFGLTGITQVSAGGHHSLAIQFPGKVMAWGDNSKAQLNGAAGVTDAIQVAAGEYHSVALRATGKVLSWGSNVFGQRTVPTGLLAVKIASGPNHILALKSDGKVVAWGDNDYGQCNVPTDLTGVVEIAAGGRHSMALKSDGTIVCWGDRSKGQCTVPILLTNVVQIAAGVAHSVGLTAGGGVWTFGDSSAGQLNMPDFKVPTSQISAGAIQSYALTPAITIVAPDRIRAGNGVNFSLTVVPFPTDVVIRLRASLPGFLLAASVVLPAGNSHLDLGFNPLPDGVDFRPFPVTLSATVDGDPLGTWSTKNILVLPALEKIEPSSKRWIGGSTSVVKATLSLPSNAASAVPYILYTNFADITVPASVTIPKGKSSVQFVVNHQAAAANYPRELIVSAYRNDGQLGLGSVQVTVDPLLLDLILVNRNPIQGGETGRALFALNAAVGSNRKATLYSTDFAFLNPTVTVVKGSQTGYFTYRAINPTVEFDALLFAGMEGQTPLYTDIHVLPRAKVETLELPAGMYGRTYRTGVLHLTRGAPLGGLTVNLSSSSDHLTIPANVFLPAGQKDAYFNILSNKNSAADITPTITAACEGSSVSMSFTVTPNLVAVALDPATVKGGASSTCTVTLSTEVAEDVVLVLSSSDPAASVPSTLTILKGTRTATFTVSTTAVTVIARPTIKAALDGKFGTARLVVNP